MTGPSTQREERADEDRCCPACHVPNRARAVERRPGPDRRDHHDRAGHLGDRRATPAVKPATATAPKTVAPKLKTVFGEVVSVDATAKTVTMKHTVSGKSEDMTFGAGEKAAAALGTLKAGDHVRVAYADVDGKPMASTIAKIVKK